jgi:hypothetical protein
MGALELSALHVKQQPAVQQRGLLVQLLVTNKLHWSSIESSTYKVLVHSTQCLTQRALEHTIDDVAHKILDGIQQIVERDERSLGFDVRVLCQVASSARLLGTIRRSNAEDVSHCRADRLEVQLR